MGALLLEMHAFKETLDDNDADVDADSGGGSSSSAVAVADTPRTFKTQRRPHNWRCRGSGYAG